MISKIFRFISYTITTILLLIILIFGIVLMFFKSQALDLLNSLETTINNTIDEAQKAVDSLNQYNSSDITNLIDTTIATLHNQLNVPNIPQDVVNSINKSITELEDLKLKINNLNLDDIKTQVTSILDQVKKVNQDNVSPFFKWIQFNYQPITTWFITAPSIFLVVWLSFSIIQTIKTKKAKKEFKELKKRN